MLLRCCLISITFIILRHILYLVYLCPCLALGLFMLYLCDQFFMFSLIFIVINHISSLKQRHDYFWIITWINKATNFQKQKFSLRVLLRFCMIFCQFQPGVAYKSVAYIKKRVIEKIVTFTVKLCNALLETINVILSAAKTIPRTTRFFLKNKARDLSTLLMKPFLTTVTLNYI